MQSEVLSASEEVCESFFKDSVVESDEDMISQLKCSDGTMSKIFRKLGLATKILARKRSSCGDLQETLSDLRHEVFSAQSAILDIRSALIALTEILSEDTKAVTNSEKKTVHCNSLGAMVACDNANCKIEWFHFRCVGLRKKPKGKWYCPMCRGVRANVLKFH